MDKDTIYRHAAIDAIQNEVEPFVMVEPGTTCVIGAGVNDADVIRVLEQLPSAQPEIIRCRDCKYWREHKYAKETKRYIPFCGFNAIYTKADDFCSRAERKENR